MPTHETAERRAAPQDSASTMRVPRELAVLASTLGLTTDHLAQQLAAMVAKGFTGEQAVQHLTEIALLLAPDGAAQ